MLFIKNLHVLVKGMIQIGINLRKKCFLCYKFNATYKFYNKNN